MNLFGHLLCPPSSPPLPSPTAQWAEATENNNSNSKSRTTTRRSRAATIIIIISLSSVKHDWRGAVPCWAALTVQYSQYSEHSLACVRPLQGVRLRVARVARKQNGVSNWGAVCGATQAQRMPCGRVCEWVRLSACVSVWVCASVCVRLCHFNLKSFACIVHFLMCGKLFFSSCMRCSPSRRFNECPNWTCPPSAPSCLSLLLPLDAWCWRWRWLWQLAHLSVVSALWSGFALTNWYVMSRNNFGRSADGIVPDSSPERQSPLRHYEVVVAVVVAANRRRRRRR